MRSEKDALYRESVKVGGNIRVVKRGEQPAPEAPPEEPVVIPDDTPGHTEEQILQTEDSPYRDILEQNRLDRREPEPLPEPDEVLSAEDVNNNRFYFEVKCDKCDREGRLLLDFASSVTISWTCLECGEANVGSPDRVAE